jgi:hypothetical protein
MQTFTYKFDPSINQTAMAWMVDANLFVYESGVAAVDGQNRAVIVKPYNGSEITLKPGQRFRLAPGADARTWAVRLVDPTVTLTANFIIGQGEFEDSNTLNTFKLDGTFTNTVAVNNTAANAVPVAVQATAQAPLPVAVQATAQAPVPVSVGAGVQVTNTAAQRVPVSLDLTQTINTNGGSILAYTGTYFQNGGAAPAGGAQMLVSPAANTKGIVLTRYSLNEQNASGATGAVSILAKASAPLNSTDGDVLDFQNLGTGSSGNIKSDMTQGLLQIPAGKGLYIWRDGAWNVLKDQFIWQVM